MKCKDCPIELTALNMSDYDETLCSDCADILIKDLQEDIPETTLVLWERRI